MTKKDLDIIQGTTKPITLELPTGYTFTTGDHVYLSVKTFFEDTSYVIQKDLEPTTGDTTVDLSLTPAETETLIAKNPYVYDIQWNKITGGDKHTLVIGMLKVSLRATEE